MGPATEEQIEKIMSKSPLVPHKMIWRDDDIGCLTSLEDVLHPRRQIDGAQASKMYQGLVERQGDRFYQKQYIEKGFMAVDAIFKKYGFIHTIAVITEDLESNLELVRYIKENPHIDPQVHCRHHTEFTGLAGELLTLDLAQSVSDIKRIFGKTPTTLYPPWNLVDDNVRAAAASVGLTVHEEKLSLQQYIRVRGHVKEDTVNFHYWSYEDVLHLDAALSVYREMGWDR